MSQRPTLGDDARSLLFTEARTANRFLDEPVAPEKLRELYELAKWGPTSMNSCPARIAFLTVAARRFTRAVAALAVKGPSSLAKAHSARFRNAAR